jgi:hypothetical protein
MDFRVLVRQTVIQKASFKKIIFSRQILDFFLNYSRTGNIWRCTQIGSADINELRDD